MDFVRALTVGCMAAFALAACAVAPVHPPEAVRADAHLGGTVTAFAPDGRRFASGGWEGAIRVWRAPAQEAGGGMAPLDGWRAHADSVNGLLWLDGRTLVSAGYDGRIALWRVRTDPATSRALHPHRAAPPTRPLPPRSGGRVGEGGAAFFRGRGEYPPVGGLPVRAPLREVRTAPVTAAAGDAAAGLLVTGHADGTVRLWRLPALAERARWRPHRGTVKAVALDAGGGADTGSGSSAGGSGVTEEGAPRRPQAGVSSRGTSLGPRGTTAIRIASAGADGRVHVWRIGAGAPRPLARPPTDAWTLAFSPDGRALYGGGWFRLFRWDLATGALAVLPTGHRGIVKSIAFLPDGRLATISRQTDSAVLLLDPATGAALTRLQPHDLCGAWVAASPDGRFLATTSDDASVRLWDLGALRPPVTSW